MTPHPIPATFFNQISLMPPLHLIGPAFSVMVCAAPFYTPAFFTSNIIILALLSQSSTKLVSTPSVSFWNPLFFVFCFLLLFIFVFSYMNPLYNTSFYNFFFLRKNLLIKNCNDLATPDTRFKLCLFQRKMFYVKKIF